MANFCAECGSNLNENFKFCPECGAKIISSNQTDTIGSEQTTLSDPTYNNTVEIIICENCGDENPSGEKICGGCGQKLEGSFIQKTVEVKKMTTEREETLQPQKSAGPRTPKKKKKTKTSKKIEPNL